MVPIRNTERVGLRRLYQQKEIKGLISLLEAEADRSATPTGRAVTARTSRR